MNELRILLVGKICGVDFDWTIAPLPMMEPPADDGALQDTIDYGAELRELQDDMEDRAFWAKGQW